MSNYIPTGAGSTHSHIPFSAWQRHTPQCDARGNVTKRAGKDCAKCRASDATREVRLHALTVALVVTGTKVRINGREVRMVDMVEGDDVSGARFTCPTCEADTLVRDAQCDRVVPGALGGRYEPGNVCLTCSECNAAKADSTPDDAWAARVRRIGLAMADRGRVLTGKDMTPILHSLMKG